MREYRGNLILKRTPLLERTFERCMAALRENIWNIKYVPTSLKNQEMVDYLLTQRYFTAVPWIPRKFKTEAFYLKHLATSAIFLEDVPLRYITPEMCKLAVDVYPDSLKWVPFEYITDEMSKDAVMANPYNIIYVPLSFQTQEMTESVVRRAPDIVANLSSWQPWYWEMVRLAFSLNGLLLKEFTDFALQGWFYWTAIEQNGLALQYAPEHIRSNPYVCWAAMKNSIAAVQFTGEKLQTVKFYKNVVRFNPDAVHYIPERFLRKVMAMSAEMKEEIIAVTGDVAYYFRHCLSEAELKEQDLTREDLEKDTFNDPNFKFGRYVVW
jgi:hypothetical protein